MNPKLLDPENPDAPKYWKYETSGVLTPVIEDYVSGKRLTREQIGLMRAYLWQWVKSPVWAPSGSLEALRLRVAAIATEADIACALSMADELGMDPL